MADVYLKMSTRFYRSMLPITSFLKTAYVWHHLWTAVGCPIWLTLTTE